jgi:hypothetical protein
MSPTTDSPRSHGADHPGNVLGRLREDMEATTLAHLAADSGHVVEAMASVTWERRGLLQRLRRGSR